MAARSPSPPPPPAWPDRIYRVFKDRGLRQVCYVPDAGHTRLIKLCHADRALATVALTTEEEGVAMLAGAWLGGDRGALLMQSSGVGNCVNMLSVAQECRIPLLMLVTMRGEWGEFNPWQIPMGQSTEAALRASGVIVERADTADEVPVVVDACAKLAFESYRPVAVLIGQRVIGFKNWKR